jgi:hypothetical protein
LVYQQLEKADAKPSYMISVLTVTFFLGAALPEQEVAGYFNKVSFELAKCWELDSDVFLIPLDISSSGALDDSQSLQCAHVCILLLATKLGCL